MSEPADIRDEVPSELEAAIYDAAFAGDPGTARLARLCEEHPEHARAVRNLFDQVRGARVALSEVTGTQPGSAGSEDLTPGTRLGPFTVIREVGRGSFGAVFLAEQSAPLRRLVAIKVLSVEASGPELLRRFGAERQVLAQLEHPGIARIFDAGTTVDHRPYLVMEFLDGSPLLRFADQRELAIEERLRLFQELCEVVEHAHQRGVIHRDLKPGNVLVVEHEGTRRIKVIDFGLAKVLAPDRLRVEPSTTEAGRLLGTPEYMSPEQASGQLVDTRADVWSLGVILFQLLTGELPFPSEELRKEGLASVVRVLSEAQAPKASERLATATAARARRTTPRNLVRRLRGDLDLIVATCLRRERDRRYGSVAELAADVRRHLEHQPIAAESPRLGYVLRKLAQRHRSAVLAVVVTALALVASTLVLAWSAIRISRASERAGREAYAATIRAAAAEASAGRAGPLRRLLSATDPGLRHVEYELLAARAEGALRVEQVSPHSTFGDTSLSSVVVRGEQVLVAAPKADELVRLSRDPGVAAEHIGVGIGVRRMVLSHDGRKLALSGSSGKLQVRDAATLEVLQEGGGTEWFGWGLTFSSEDQSLWVSSERAISEFDATTLRLRSRVPLPEDAFCIAPHPEDGTLAVGCGDGYVHFVDPGDGTTSRKLFHGDGVMAIAIVEPDRMVSGGRDGVLRLWDLNALQCIAAHETASWGFQDLAVSADRRTLLCPLTEGQAQVFAAKDLQRLGTFVGHEARVSHAAALRGGGWVTSSWDGTVRFWPASPPPRAEAIESIHGAPLRIVLDPNRTVAHVACLGGSLGTYDLERHHWIWLHRSGANVAGIAVSGSRHEVFAAIDSEVHVFDANHGGWLRSGRIGSSALWDLQWRELDRELVACAEDGSVTRVDASSLTVLGSCKTPPELAERTPENVLVHSGGTLATTFCRTANEQLRTFDLTSGRLVWTAKGIASNVVLADGGKSLLALHTDGQLATIDPHTGRVEPWASEFVATSGALAISKDGRRLIVGCEDLRIVELADGRVVHTSPSGRFPIMSVAYDPERGILITGGGRFTDPSDILIWPLRQEAPR